MDDFTETMSLLRSTLRREGVRGVVMHLNKLTEHRFTSLYRFDRDRLESLCFYDRENPAQLSTPSIPILASYCVFVRDSGRPFAVDDSLLDARVRGHPKELLVRSYCGVPLIGEDHRVFGSVCHFDLEPRAMSGGNLELLEAVATLLNELFAEELSTAAPGAARP
jgi:GAF domain-containing protein